MDYIELCETDYRRLEKYAKEWGVTKSEMLSYLIKRLGYLSARYDIISAKMNLSPEEYNVFMNEVQEQEDIISWRIHASRIRAGSNLGKNKEG